MKIRIQTAQNVEIEYEVAGLGYRLQAALIDAAIFVGYYAAIYILYVPLGFGGPGTAWTVYILAAPPVPLLLYPLICELVLDGQTVGKRAMNLKVVRVDGGEPSIGAYLLRWIFWIVEANPLVAVTGLGAISIVSVVTSRYGQRVGDIAAGTTVVRMQKDENRPIEISRLGDNLLPTNAEVLFPTASRLSPEQVGAIREVIEAAESGVDSDIYTPLAYGIADVIGVPTATTGIPESFVRRVLDDYIALSTGLSKSALESATAASENLAGTRAGNVTPDGTPPSERDTTTLDGTENAAD